MLNRRQFGSTLGFTALSMMLGTGRASASAAGNSAAGIDVSSVNPQLRPYARTYTEK
jgi:hypothetical protein